jgi:hypothetical protein
MPTSATFRKQENILSGCRSEEEYWPWIEARRRHQLPGVLRRSLLPYHVEGVDSASDKES